jgi:DMSO/TMAO reductase YedYZ heme-binding membrane subunit
VLGAIATGVYFLLSGVAKDVIYNPIVALGLALLVLLNIPLLTASTIFLRRSSE